jgi:hypothetical protein
MDIDEQYGDDASDFKQFIQDLWRTDALRRDRIRQLEPRLRALRDFLIKAAGSGVKLHYRADLAAFPADLRWWPMDEPDLRTW